MTILHTGIPLLISTTWFLLAGLSAAGNVCREFASTNGSTIKGQLLDYDSADQMVTVRREGSEKPGRAHVTVCRDWTTTAIEAGLSRKAGGSKTHYPGTVVTPPPVIRFSLN